ncbi:TBC1 domain family member 31 isoform X2 [Hermetia illucens]|nr:TBC1 domain family member 31 isoform X2 [Hermetia illucens]
MVLFGLETFEKKGQWKYNENKVSIKYASMIPNSERFFACFSNDNIYVWSEHSHDAIRVVSPLRLKSHYKKDDILNVMLSGKESGESSTHLVDMTSDIGHDMIRGCKLSMDGKLICLTTGDSIILLSTSDFEINKIIRTNGFSCRAAEVVPQSSNNILYALTTRNQVLLINIDKSNIKVMMQTSNVYRMSLSRNGKLLGIVFKTGEVKLVRTSVGISTLNQVAVCAQEIRKPTISAKTVVSNFQSEMQQLLPQSRLASILKEFGEYPEKHRHLIWCTLLKLPNNKKAFTELLRRGLHPAVEFYHKIYPLKDASILRSLKRTMSCLIHWCNAFLYSRFLPDFIFPFLKIFPNSPMLTFELLISILLNHGQLWFEFSPMEPLNYLGIVENILTEFCPNLAQFYREKDIGAKIYAWPLLSTAFSQVLDAGQWYQLWDNIVCNKPTFLVFCVVAYNILQKPTIMSLKTNSSIESFFFDQNVINVKKLVKCATVLMNTCPDSLHPKRYMHVYEPLPLGFYPKFENYPKQMTQLKDQEIENLRQENVKLDKQLGELAKGESELLQQLEKKMKKDVHRKRMKDVEKCYSEAIERETERIRYQQKMLLLYKRQMRSQEMKILGLMHKSTGQEDLNSRMEDLDSLMNRIESNRLQQEMNMLCAEDNLNDKKLKLITQKQQLQQNTRENEPLHSRYRNAIKGLSAAEDDLTTELKRISQSGTDELSVARENTVEKINRFKADLGQIEAAFVRSVKKD